MDKLSRRRMDDVPFIGSDPEDFYYETTSGKVFDMTENRFFPDFDSWCIGIERIRRMVVPSVYLLPLYPEILKRFLFTVVIGFNTNELL